MVPDAEGAPALSAAEAGRRVAAGAVSPVELVEACLARIEAVDGLIHSYITVLPERAREAARRAEAEIRDGRRRSPLHGVPFAVKDNYHVAGVRTTAASRLMLDHVADTTATAVSRLEEAGAILLGKLNTWEFGTGSGLVQEDLPFPVARNPWDPTRLTGGSSTGAGASVAAGTALFALGSDTGGSVRLPAAACGLAGLKPTYGRVSRAACLPNCWSLDCNGPLAWTAEDAALVLGIVSGHDPADPSSAEAAVPDFAADLGRGVADMRIGVLRDIGPEGAAWDAAQRDAFEAFVAVLRDLGADLREVALPAPLSEFQRANRIINWGESYSIHERDFLERRHLMGQALREKMTCGFQLRAADYIAATRRRRQLAAAMDGLMRDWDAIVLPGALHVAPPAHEPATVVSYTADNACSMFNLTGHPAMVVCTGFAGGLPLNAQIAGRYFDEAGLLRVASAYESATPWRQRRPMLAKDRP